MKQKYLLRLDDMRLHDIKFCQNLKSGIEFIVTQKPKLKYQLDYKKVLR